MKKNFEVTDLSKSKDVVKYENRNGKNQPGYNFCYILNVNNKFYRVVTLDNWGTEDEMQEKKWGIWSGASIFRKTVSVLVYVLCRDGYYYLCSTANSFGNNDLLLPFRHNSVTCGDKRPEEMPWDGLWDETAPLPEEKLSDGTSDAVVHLYMNGAPFYGYAAFVDGYNGYESAPNDGMLCAVVATAGSPNGSCWDENGNPNAVTDKDGNPIILKARRGSNRIYQGYMNISFEDAWYGNGEIAHKYGFK